MALNKMGEELRLMQAVTATSEEAGWTQREWEILAHDRPLMGHLGRIIRGECRLGTPIFQSEIDWSATPSIPANCVIEVHERDCERTPVPVGVRIQFWPVLPRRNGQRKRGTDLLHELRGKAIYNALLLDYLFENPLFISHGLKNSRICALGTRFRHSQDKDLRVSYLYYADGWNLDSRSLDHEFTEDFVIPYFTTAESFL